MRSSFIFTCLRKINFGQCELVSFRRSYNLQSFQNHTKVIVNPTDQFFISTAVKIAIHLVENGQNHIFSHLHVPEIRNIFPCILLWVSMYFIMVMITMRRALSAQAYLNIRCPQICSK